MARDVSRDRDGICSASPAQELYPAHTQAGTAEAKGKEKRKKNLCP